MSNRSFSYLAGTILILFGVMLTLDRLDIIDFRFWHFIGSIWPLILIAFGLWLIYKQTKKEKDWKEAIIVSKFKAFGNMAIKPDEIGDSGADYKVGCGDMKLDFTETKFPAGENRIDISIGCGDVFIVLPNSMSCKILSKCGLGDITIFGNRDSGFGISKDFMDTDYDLKNTRIIMRAKCGFGDIRIKRDK